jgi:DHA2 family multidrug resistance protein-like MFS transporter
MENEEGLPPGQRAWAILVVALGITLAVLDSSIANVALPTIARTLNAQPAASIWVVNAYQIAITISLLPLAALGDIVGYRRVYLVGMTLFTLASLGCALSDSLLALTVTRVLQGLGAAGIMSVNTALVRMIYPPRLLGRGISINAMVVALSSAVGPTVASAVLSVASWPWLFAINVPIGVIAFTIGSRALPMNIGHKHRYDVFSALLNAATFGLAFVALDGLAHGAPRAYVVLEAAAAIAIGYVFVRRQLTRPMPLLPVDLLKRPLFALSIGTSIGSFTAQMLAFVSLPFYLQYVFGRSPVETGLLMTPWPLTIAVVAPIAGYLADRYSSGVLGGIGLLTFALGLASLAALPAHPSDFDLIWRMSLCGFGFGLFQSPNNRTILASAPRERSGGASGMLSTARLTGQTIGATLVALLFNLSAMHGAMIALIVAAVCAMAAAAVSFMRVKAVPPTATPAR